MRQKMICWIVGLIVSAMPMMGANVTNSPEHLVFGKKWIEGASRAKLVHCLHVEVTNTGESDFQGWWKAIDSQTGRMVEAIDFGVRAGETKDVATELCFTEPGIYELTFESEGFKLFDYTVDIGEYVAPKVKGSLQVDMLEKTDEGNILYGDFAHFRITGTATLTNEDENTVFGWGGFVAGGGSGIDVAVNPWLLRDNYAYKHLYSLGHELKSGQTITKDFEYEFVAVPEDGKEYGISLVVLGNDIVSIPFTVKQCTNTYWTADGHVKPLPVADQVLKVPTEALTVDLRGLYEINTIYSIDVSEANPNCLYFLGYLDYVPKSLASKTNIIRDYDAKDIIINGDYDYYCPMPFNTKMALFDYTPVSETMGPATSYMSQIMSGAVILPFNAQKIWLTAMNDSYSDDAFYNEDDVKIYSYLSNNQEKLLFTKVANKPLTAYTPYLLFTKPSPVAFLAEDVTIPSTRRAEIDMGDGLFTASTTAETAGQGSYIWNGDKYRFLLNHEPILLRPFTPYITFFTDENRPEEIDYDILINSGDVVPSGTDPVLPDSSTPVTAVNAVSSHPQAVYSLSGQRVGTAGFVNGRLSVEGLRPGLYIVNGRKMIVK